MDDNIGMEAVKQALAAGHAVTAVVRDPAKMTITHDNLTVATANIFDPETLKPFLINSFAIPIMPEPPIPIK